MTQSLQGQTGYLEQKIYLLSRISFYEQKCQLTLEKHHNNV